MPRKARLDIPGFLQHITARGVHGETIFYDSTDKESFVARLAELLEETKTKCYAWALLPNHFHLLIRPYSTSLKTFMHRLMSGYSVSFNNKYKRSGHIFQSRYRSFICQEEPYMMEFIRYIHLNPYRVGLVESLDQLDVYSFSGHAAMVGKIRNPLRLFLKSTDQTGEQVDSFLRISDQQNSDKSIIDESINEALQLFGKDTVEARINYNKYLWDGISLGNRFELQGGGWMRSTGNTKRHLNYEEESNKELWDERILGKGDFVKFVLDVEEKIRQQPPEKQLPLVELIDRVSSYYKVDTDILMSRSQNNIVSKARSVICHVAVHKMKYPGTIVAKMMKIKCFSALRCAKKGEKLVSDDTNLQELLKIENKI